VRSVKRSALVPFTPAQMYALVEDVERYPEFLPWCAGAQLHERDEHALRASIDIGLAGLSSRFGTRNELDPPHRMTMELVEGPFESLHGEWQFVPVGDSGCEARLSMQFAFASRTQDALFGVAFEKICNELIDAFIRRAQMLYG
jgi:ribosome-associated toxin RatA of RatAB toxin-antitoxin module